KRAVVAPPGSPPGSAGVAPAKEQSGSAPPAVSGNAPEKKHAAQEKEELPSEAASPSQGSTPLQQQAAPVHDAPAPASEREESVPAPQPGSARRNSSTVLAWFVAALMAGGTISTYLATRTDLESARAAHAESLVTIGALQA